MMLNSDFLKSPSSFLHLLRGFLLKGRDLSFFSIRLFIHLYCCRFVNSHFITLVMFYYYHYRKLISEILFKYFLDLYIKYKTSAITRKPKD